MSKRVEVPLAREPTDDELDVIFQLFMPKAAAVLSGRGDDWHMAVVVDDTDIEEWGEP